MIYTSYFANLKNIPDTITPVAICAKVPKWFTGICYRALAPSYDILMNYKNSGDFDNYTDRYRNEILSTLDPESVVKKLMYLSGNEDIVLLCYEKDFSQCHRSLVSKWLVSYGFECKEYT